jgi:hypothetical protein
MRNCPARDCCGRKERSDSTGSKFNATLVKNAGAQIMVMPVLEPIKLFPPAFWENFEYWVPVVGSIQSDVIVCIHCTAVKRAPAGPGAIGGRLEAIVATEEIILLLKIPIRNFMRS